ncbi:LolA-related protein [Sulfuriferula thiophila]|uniref:LolA-related protein n=1 Tax=Sulfuriferula thiophila TaxID=1781211 RepID=UPI001CB92680|nr:LolA-related protein [Sulfuriferula thiophila]
MMTPTRRLSRTILVTFALLLGNGLATVSHAATWDIDQLMHSLAQTRSGHASFVETKSIAMLEQPIESSGELFYTAPDRMEKRTFKPKPETMVVDGDNLLIERKQQKYRLQLPDYPELAAFINSVRGTLAGDRKALERTYQLSLEGTAQNWTLQLIPVSARMKQVVTRIRIAGVNDEVRSIDIMQADGDSSQMRIEKLATP